MALTAKKVYAILKRQISDMEAKLNSPVRYRGTVATADLLPLNPDIGDMYNIESKSVYGEAGMNVAWNGVVWDTMGAPIDMSLYIKSNELADWVKQQNKPTYTANEVGALPADTKIPSKTSDLQNDSGFLTKIPDNYLSGTDKTLSVSGKAADAKVTGEKIAKNSSDITKKLDKNQGVENSGKIAGINESGDIVPMFPVGVEYNEETNCLEFGSDQKMELNQGIGLDSSLTKTGYAADAGVVGEVTNSLKESMTNIHQSSSLVDFENISWIENAYIDNNTGEEIPYANWVATDYIELTPQRLACIHLNDDGIFSGFLGQVYYAWYDSDKKYLIGANRKSVLDYFDVNAKYIRLSFGKAQTSHVALNTEAIIDNLIGKDISYFVPYGKIKIFNEENIAKLQGDMTTKITKFYASSQGETHLADSDDGKIMDMMLYGRSEQKQYSGKNLLNAMLQTTTSNGITCTANGDGTYTVNGTATDNALFYIFNGIINAQKVKLCGCPSIANDSTYFMYMYVNNDLSTNVKDYGNGTSSLSIDGLNLKVVINIKNGVTVNNLLFKPMIVDAEKYPTATYDDYEPYTGGIPSPNPDYPQEIKSVVNPTVKVCGKNLLDSKKFPIILNRAIATDTGVVYESLGGKYCATEKYIPFPYGGKIISFNDSMSLCAYDKDYKFISAIRYHSQAPFGTTYVRFDIKIEDKDKAQIELSESTTTYEPYHEQTVTLPYTLNAIPVSAGGNVTIDGQQYIADYVDVERGKLVRMCKRRKLFEMSIQDWGTGDNGARKDWYVDVEKYDYTAYTKRIIPCLFSSLRKKANQMEYPYFTYETIENNGWQGYSRLSIYVSKEYDTLEKLKEYIGADTEVVYQLKTPEEIDLTPEEIAALKALATYYPTTNINVNSEQLDGYTVFNYPISMENGWNYVKQQIGDTRDYIYDMDARTQDTDLQAAEAYVNSEYAVALTELEV